MDYVIPDGRIKNFVSVSYFLNLLGKYLIMIIYETGYDLFVE
jgi:hypothetical protein